ncbi:MAG TPA: phosphoribosylamine--glycine ligase, partial [Candidatus Peregrinibacteria bacterium]|nr:phosphoribosylamine--glycine ligase [Candidatus Peregrinibacteria bacterium]
VLLIGNGAREHAIAEALKRSPAEVELVVFANKKNPGIFELASNYVLTDDLSNFDNLRQLVVKEKPHFAFIGPDNPIADGAADELEKMHVPSVGPKKSVARVESSKSFARDLLVKYKIPGCPRFRVFFSMEGIDEYLDELQGEYVIKADGLMYGKGVKVSGEHLENTEEAINYCRECFKSSDKVIVEEKLYGPEFSLMSFVDGKNVVDMPPVQDHKRAFERDQGPNTGGMGSYSDANHLLPFVTKEDLEIAHKINQLVTKALYEETGVYFKGILYGGFMLTKEGVKLIEYNARFGDPEAMNVLPILKTDFVDICLSIIEGTLDKLDVEFEEKATVCKYAVPQGYPDHPQANSPLDFSEVPKDVRYYYASVNEKDGQILTSTSRAVGFVGIADTLPEAEEIAEKAIRLLKGNIFHRPDIGTEALIQQRVKMMEGIRTK